MNMSIETRRKLQDEEKIRRLRENKHSALLMVLKEATIVEWDVSAYPKVQPANNIECNYLYDTARRLYLFCDMGRENPVALDGIKRDKLWESFLSEHCAEECELLLWARRHELPEKLGLIPILTLSNLRSPNRGARWT